MINQTIDERILEHLRNRVDNANRRLLNAKAEADHAQDVLNSVETVIRDHKRLEEKK